MRFGEFAATTFLVVSSAAAPTRRQALLDSISNSTIEQIIEGITAKGDIAMLGDLVNVAVDALAHEASAVSDCYAPGITSSPATSSLTALESDLPITVGLSVPSSLDSNSQSVSVGDGALPLPIPTDGRFGGCLLYTSPSPRDGLLSRMPSSA